MRWVFEERGLLSINNCINPTSNIICLCAVLTGLGTCTGVFWELVYAKEKIHGPVICLLVLTKVEKVTLQVFLGARPLPGAGFYSSTLGPEPGNPRCPQLRWWPLKAARLWCQPSGPQSNCPSAGPSCCAGSPSGTRGLPGYTGAETADVSERATGSCCHSACWWCTLREWRSVPYQRQLSAACRPWAVPCSRCIWHLRACESCRGSQHEVRPGIIALLWWLRCNCHATAIILGAVMVGLALLLLLWAIIGAIADGKSCAGGLLLHRLLLPWWLHVGE